MAWTDPSAGQTLTAAKVAELASYGVPIQAEKASATSRNTTTSPTADPELVIVLPANRTYDVRVALLVTAGNAAGDIRIAFGWTNTATVTYTGLGPVKTLASGTTGDGEFFSIGPDNTSTSTAVGYGASSTVTTVWADARVVTGGSNVTLSLLWSQDTSSATNSTLEAGSKMIARRANV
jgi:hypothetical protein